MIEGCIQQGCNRGLVEGGGGGGGGVCCNIILAFSKCYLIGYFPVTFKFYISLSAHISYIK